MVSGRLKNKINGYCSTFQMTDWIDKAFDIKETKRPPENMFSDGLDIDGSAYQSIVRRISRRAFCQSDGLIPNSVSRREQSIMLYAGRGAGRGY